METIYKYPLAMIDSQKIEMPVNAQILCAQVQRHEVCLWAQVAVDDPRARTAEREILIVGTGNPLPARANRYIGTVQLTGAYDGLVFHVYEGTSGVSPQ